MLYGETDLAVSDSMPPKEANLGYDIQWQAGKRPSSGFAQRGPISAAFLSFTIRSPGQSERLIGV